MCPSDLHHGHGLLTMFDYGFDSIISGDDSPEPVASDSTQSISIGVNFRGSMKKFRREIPWERRQGHCYVPPFVFAHREAGAN